MRTNLLAVLAALALLSACRNGMETQPKFTPLAPSSLFDDGRSARPIPEGTVARGQLDADPAFYQGMAGGKHVEDFPVPVTRELLARGQERYNIYCAPCHDTVGNGLGMIVRRGYRRPPSFHIDRLRKAAAGYYFDVITNGFGAMPAYAQQVPPGDRWAIVAYLRALQLSRYAPAADLPPRLRAKLPQGGGQ